MSAGIDATRYKERRSFFEVLWVFLRLGVTSFGGPIAHLGYFRAEFVERRKWLDEAAYTDIIALCQFLPGPASSQVCIILGMLRAGLSGVAPCKRVKLCRLKWRPRQSLASSRVPSLAWRSVTTAAKRRQGGCRSEQQ
jgi:Chromate transporter